MNIRDLKPVRPGLLWRHAIVPAGILLPLLAGGIYWVVTRHGLTELLLLGLAGGWMLGFALWFLALDIRALWLGMLPRPAERHHVRLAEGRLEIRRGTETLSIPLQQIRKIRWVTAEFDFDAATKLSDTMVLFRQNRPPVQVSLWDMNWWDLRRSLSTQGLCMENVEVSLPSWI